MNTLRKIFLYLLRMPLFPRLFLKQIVRYLVHKLEIDEVQFVLKPHSFRDVLSIIQEKLIERRELLSYDRLSLCRILKGEDGELISEDEVKWLEETITLENQLAKISLPAPDIPIQKTLFWGAGQFVMKVYSPTTGEFMGILQQTRLAALPWERDPSFFVEHPEQSQRYKELVKAGDDIAWCTEIFRCFIT